MARTCSISGKKPGAGNLRSHSNHATRRRFLPNLISKRVFDPLTKKMTRKRIATSALRTLAKQHSSLTKKGAEMLMGL